MRRTKLRAAKKLALARRSRGQRTLTFSINIPQALPRAGVKLLHPKRRASPNIWTDLQIATGQVNVFEYPYSGYHHRLQASGFGENHALTCCAHFLPSLARPVAPIREQDIGMPREVSRLDGEHLA